MSIFATGLVALFRLRTEAVNSGIDTGAVATAEPLSGPSLIHQPGAVTYAGAGAAQPLMREP